MDLISGVLATVQPILEYAGTIAFVVSGAVLARANAWTVVVLGCIVAVGGGTTRDVLLQQPVFWVTRPTFVMVAAVVAVATLPLHREGIIQWGTRYNLVSISAAAGMALFVITGTNVALPAEASPVAAALVRVIAGVGGGIIRYVLAMQIPDVLRNGQFYASAAFIGAVGSCFHSGSSDPAGVAVGTTTWAWCRPVEHRDDRGVLGQEPSQDSNGQCEPMPRERRS